MEGVGMHENIIIETEIGPLEVSFIEFDHVNVSSLNGSHLTVRGKEYTTSVHVWRDQGWRPRPDSYISVNRRDYFRYSDAAAPRTIRAKILEHCYEAVREAMRRDPDAPVRAGVAHLRRERQSCDTKRSALLEEAHRLQVRIVELHNERKRIDPEGKYGSLGGQIS
jgi:hypothetical protein